MPSRFPFTSYPRGWFRVAAADELKNGAVRPLHYFGRDLVLFRGDDGKAHLLDAHCPHLGTHLGYGGEVVGNAIQCPFHGWRVNGDGACIHIPYSDRIPRDAHIRSWPLDEVNGTLMAYHDPARGDPDWHVPELPEFGSTEWTPFKFGARWQIRTHVQEVGENGLDSAHFNYLHPQQTRSMRTDAVDVDGDVFVHRTFQHFNIFGLAKIFVDEVSGPLDIYYHGLGCAVNRTRVDAKVSLHYTFVFYYTPIDKDSVEVHMAASMRKLPLPFVNGILLRKAIREGRQTINQDVPIWENKIYRQRPNICAADGPIMQYRKWASRYYDDGPGVGIDG